MRTEVDHGAANLNVHLPADSIACEKHGIGTILKLNPRHIHWALMVQCHAQHKGDVRIGMACAAHHRFLHGGHGGLVGGSGGIWHAYRCDRAATALASMVA